MLNLIYMKIQPLPEAKKRNKKIYNLSLKGVPKAEIARQMGLTRQRIYEIIDRQKRNTVQVLDKIEK